MIPRLAHLVPILAAGLLLSVGLAACQSNGAASTAATRYGGPDAKAAQAEVERWPQAVRQAVARETEGGEVVRVSRQKDQGAYMVGVRKDSKVLLYRFDEEGELVAKSDMGKAGKAGP